MPTPYEVYTEAKHWIKSNHQRAHAQHNVLQARLIRELTGVFLFLSLLLLALLSK